MQRIDSESYPFSEGYQFDLSGGALCLDFVNTLGDRPRNKSEHLHSYGDLLAWSRQTEILEGPVLRKLVELAQAKPSAAHSVLIQAKEVREILYRVISALALGKELAASLVVEQCIGCHQQKE